MVWGWIWFLSNSLSVFSPRLRDRKHTTRWIKIIFKTKPWEILYVMLFPNLYHIPYYLATPISARGPFVGPRADIGDRVSSRYGMWYSFCNALFFIYLPKYYNECTSWNNLWALISSFSRRFSRRLYNFRLISFTYTEHFDNFQSISNQ